MEASLDLIRGETDKLAYQIEKFEASVASYDKLLQNTLDIDQERGDIASSLTAKFQGLNLAHNNNLDKLNNNISAKRLVVIDRKTTSHDKESSKQKILEEIEMSLRKSHEDNDVLDTSLNKINQEILDLDRQEQTIGADLAALKSIIENTKDYSLDHLSSEISDLEFKLTSLQQSQSDEAKMQADLEENNDHLKEKLETVEDEITDLDSCFSGASVSLSRLSETSQDLTAKLAEATKDEEALELKMQLFTQSKNEFLCLSKVLQETTMMNSQLEEEVKKLSSVDGLKDQLNQENSSISQEAHQIEDLISSKMSEIKEIKEALKVEDNRFQEHEAEARQLSAQIKKITSEQLEPLKMKEVDLLKQQDSLSNLARDLDLQSSEAASRDLDTKLTSSSARLGKILTDKEAVRQELPDLEEQLAQVQQKSSLVEAENELLNRLEHRHFICSSTISAFNS